MSAFVTVSWPQEGRDTLKLGEDRIVVVCLQEIDIEGAHFQSRQCRSPSWQSVSFIKPEAADSHNDS